MKNIELLMAPPTQDHKPINSLIVAPELTFLEEPRQETISLFTYLTRIVDRVNRNEGDVHNHRVLNFKYSLTPLKPHKPLVLPFKYCLYSRLLKTILYKKITWTARQLIFR